MAFLLPTLGASGLFTLNPPFAAKLLANTNYTLVAIRKLSEIVAAGGDPFTDYYAPLSIDMSTYTADLTAGAVLLSLQAADSSIVNVPNSYLAAYPNGGSIPYTAMCLAIRLGAIADSVDLSYLKQQLAELVMDTVGITSTVDEVAISNTSLLTQDDSAKLETARQANIASSLTTAAALKQANANLASATAKITELENYIMSLPVAQGGTGTVGSGTSTPTDGSGSTGSTGSTGTTPPTGS